MRSLPLLLALTAFSLVGLFYLLKPVAPKPATATTIPQAVTESDRPGSAEKAGDETLEAGTVVAKPIAAENAAVQVRYEVVEGNRVLGPDRILVRQGQEVQIEVLSDRVDELHLHGYDLHLPLLPGQVATMSLHAEHSGRFELELHKQHLTLAALEVHPG